MATNDREIERKYLLRGLPAVAAAAGAVEIDQGYLPGERILERIRRIRRVEGGAPVGLEQARYFRTVKLGSGLERLEFEEETTEVFFLTVWPLTRGRRVQKRRYTVASGSDEWEIDEFIDRPLVLAEIELEHAQQAVSPPLWLEPHIEREVTDDPEYSNYALAR
jgi:CYTH domain-containing protein